MGQVGQSIYCNNLSFILILLISKLSPFAPDIKVLANFLGSPFASGVDSVSVGWPYVVFDLNPTVVKVSVF